MSRSFAAIITTAGSTENRGFSQTERWLCGRGSAYLAPLDQCGNGTASDVLFVGSRWSEKTITPAMTKNSTTARTMKTFTLEVRFLKFTGGVGSFLSRPIKKEKEGWGGVARWRSKLVRRYRLEFPLVTLRAPVSRLRSQRIS